MLKQLAIFVENIPGSLKKVTTAMSDENLNIYALSAFDTPEFGILRIVVDKPEEAKGILTSKGFVTKVCDVIAVELPDEQGSMDKLLTTMHDSNININYAYSSFGRMSKIPAVILHSDDIFEAESVLQGKGFHCIKSLA